MSGIDFKKCFLCQSENTNDLRDPSKHCGKSHSIYKPYENLASNILELRQLGQLPFSIDVDLLNSQYGGLEEAMRTNNAIWHKRCRNLVDNQKVIRARERQNTDTVHSPVKTRRMSGESSRIYSTSTESIDAEKKTEKEPTCFLCDQPRGKYSKSGFYKVATLGIDTKVRSAAKTICDKALLRKIANGDLISQGCHYHLVCLTKLYRQEDKIKKQSGTQAAKIAVLKAQGLAELIDYVESYRNTNTILQMNELYHLYSVRLLSLGVDSYVHTSRLRASLLSAIPDLKEIRNTSNNHIDLAFDCDLSKAMLEISSHDCDSEVILLSQAAKILRRYTLDQNNNFTGSFSRDCQEESVPTILLTFMQMVLDGPGITKNQKADQIPSMAPAVKSLSQLIAFNTVNRRTNTPDRVARHLRDRETPLAIYIAIKIYSMTRKETLIDILHEKGLCISYKRLRTITTDIANSVVAHFESNGVVVPLQAERGIFTTFGYDNIDHNPRATTCRSSFHGTCISLLQFPESSNQRDREPDSRAVMNPEVMGKNNVAHLPVSYTNIPQINLPKDSVDVPPVPVESSLRPETRPLTETLKDVYEWLTHAHGALEVWAMDSCTTKWISWAAYFANKFGPPLAPVTPSMMLPLFREAAHSPMMVFHGMNIVAAVTKQLNPGQTPVMVVDQLLFTLAEKIQWKFSDILGEDKFVVMLGALHTEKMLYEVLGDWLEGSGWTSLLSVGGVASSGVANSMIKVTHLTRTRYMHQVTALALYSLLRQAHREYLTTTIEDEPLELDDWTKCQRVREPHFLYWHQTLELQLTVLQFVKSIRTASFDLYLETLEHLIPWVYALDHIHYARNLPIHLRDMCALQGMHPTVHQEFMNGKFVGQKTGRAFSGLALDQVHEQLIGSLKGDGGIIGLTEDPVALERFMITGPEISRIIEEFENTPEMCDKKHHEQYHKYQETFRQDVNGLISAFSDVGNPFLEESGQLISLENSRIMTDNVVSTMKNITKIGKNKYDEFFSKRILSSIVPWTSTFHLDKLPLFSVKVKQYKDKSELASLKEERTQFIQMMLSGQSGRDIDEDMFAQENSTCPPSLSSHGQMHKGTKSDILKCLVGDIEDSTSDTSPYSDVVILDGAFIVQSLRPGTASTFQGYAEKVILPYYVMSWL